MRTFRVVAEKWRWVPGFGYVRRPSLVEVNFTTMEVVYFGPSAG